jgi:hypothetical protein
MVRQYQFARQVAPTEIAVLDVGSPDSVAVASEVRGLSSCEHRTVSRDGRIICARIVDGDNEVSPNSCRACPHKKANCAHLRFSLRQTRASPLTVRHNGRTEIWDDDPPEIGFERAACAEKVVPIYQPSSCQACPLRKPLHGPEQRSRRRRRVTGTGKVVSFPSRKALAPAG